jgi:hypothetical protein
MLFCVALIGDKVFYCRITGAILLALSIIMYYLSSMKCHDVFSWVTFDIDDKFQQHVGNHGQCAPGQRKSHRPQGLLPNPLASIVLRIHSREITHHPANHHEHACWKNPPTKPRHWQRLPRSDHPKMSEPKSALVPPSHVRQDICYITQEGNGK